MEDFFDIYNHIASTDNGLPKGVSSQKDFKDYLKNNPEDAKGLYGYISTAGYKGGEDDFHQLYNPTVSAATPKSSPVKKKNQPNKPVKGENTSALKSLDSISKSSSSSTIDSPFEYQEIDGKLKLVKKESGEVVADMPSVPTKKTDPLDREPVITIADNSKELAVIDKRLEQKEIDEEEAERQRRQSFSSALKIEKTTDGIIQPNYKPYGAKEDEGAKEFLKGINMDAVFEDLDKSIANQLGVDFVPHRINIQNELNNGKTVDYSKIKGELKAKYPYLPESFFEQLNDTPVGMRMESMVGGGNPFNPQTSNLKGVDIDMVENYLESRTDLDFKQKNELRESMLSDVRTKRTSEFLHNKTTESLKKDGIEPLEDVIANLEAQRDLFVTEIQEEYKGKVTSLTTGISAKYETESKAYKEMALKEIQQKVSELQNSVNNGQLSKIEAENIVKDLALSHDTQLRKIRNQYQARQKAKAVAIQKSMEARLNESISSLGFEEEDLREYMDVYKSYYNSHARELGYKQKVEEDKRYRSNFMIGKTFLENGAVGAVGIIDGAASFLSMYGYEGMGELSSWAELAMASAPQPILDEFGWGSLIESDWWNTKFAQALGSSAPLMVTGIGTTMGTANALKAVSSLTKLQKGMIAGSVGAVTSRPVESAVEAGGTYKQALQKGYSHEEAVNQADYVFAKNMNLIVLDAVQLGATFGVAPSKLNALNQTRTSRALNTINSSKPISFGFNMTVEGFEELYQGYAQATADGTEIDFLDYAQTSEGKEAFTLGAFIGGGMSIGTLFSKTPNQVKAVNDLMMLYMEESEGKSIDEVPIEKVQQRQMELAASLYELLEGGIIPREEFDQAISILDKTTQAYQSVVNSDVAPASMTDMIELVSLANQLEFEASTANEADKILIKQRLSQTNEVINSIAKGDYKGTVRIQGKVLSTDQAVSLIKNKDLFKKVSKEDIEINLGNEAFVAEAFKETENESFLEEYVNQLADELGIETETSMEQTVQEVDTALQEGKLKQIVSDETTSKQLVSKYAELHDIDISTEGKNASKTNVEVEAETETELDTETEVEAEVETEVEVSESESFGQKVEIPARETDVSSIEEATTVIDKFFSDVEESGEANNQDLIDLRDYYNHAVKNGDLNALNDVIEFIEESKSELNQQGTADTEVASGEIVEMFNESVNLISELSNSGVITETSTKALTAQIEKAKEDGDAESIARVLNFLKVKSSEQTKRLEDKNIEEVFNSVGNVTLAQIDTYIEKYASEYVKKVYQLIRPAVIKINPRVSIAPATGLGKTAGTYNLTGNYVNLNFSGLDWRTETEKSAMMVHELIHSISSYIIYAVKNKSDSKFKSIYNKLSTEQISAAEDLIALFDSLVRPSGKEVYGFKNEKEFLAELSNPKFAKILQEKSGFRKGTLEKIKEIVAQIMGISPLKKGFSVLKDFVNSVDTKALYAYPKNSTDKKGIVDILGGETTTEQTISNEESQENNQEESIAEEAETSKEVKRQDEQRPLFTTSELIEYIEEHGTDSQKYIVRFLNSIGWLDFVNIIEGNKSKATIQIKANQLKFEVSINKKDFKDTSKAEVITHELVHILTSIPSLIKNGHLRVENAEFNALVEKFWETAEKTKNDFIEYSKTIEGRRAMIDAGFARKMIKGWRVYWSSKNFTVEEFVSEAFSNERFGTVLGRGVYESETKEGGFTKDTFWNRIKDSFYDLYKNGFVSYNINDDFNDIPLESFRDSFLEIMGYQNGELFLDDSFNVVKPPEQVSRDNARSFYETVNEFSGIDHLIEVIDYILSDDFLSTSLGNIIDVNSLENQIKEFKENGDVKGLREALDSMVETLEANYSKGGFTRMTEDAVERLIQEKEYVVDETDDSFFKNLYVRKFDYQIAKKQFGQAVKKLLGKSPAIKPSIKSMQTYTEDDVLRAEFMYANDPTYEIDEESSLYKNAYQVAKLFLKMGKWSFVSFANHLAAKGLGVLNTKDHAIYHAAFQRAKREFRVSSTSMGDFDYRLSFRDNLLLNIVDRNYLLKKLERHLQANGLIDSSINELGSAYQLEELTNSQIAQKVDGIFSWFRGKHKKIGKKANESFLVRYANAVNEHRETIGLPAIESEKLISDLNNYLYILHYEERNARTKEVSTDRRNRKLQDFRNRRDNAKTEATRLKYEGLISDILAGKSDHVVENGSGMTEAQATKILNELTSEHDISILDKFAQEFKDEIVTKRIQLLFDNDIITEEEYDTLINGKRNGKWLDNDGTEKDYTEFKNYVPLFVDGKALVNSDKTIRMYNEEGSELTFPSKKDGRPVAKHLNPTENYTYESRSNILENSILEITATHRFIERQKSRRKLAEYVRMQGDKNYWRIVESGTQVTIGEDGSVVGYKNKVSEGVKKNSISFIENGKQSYLLFIPSMDAQGNEVPNPILASLKGQGIFSLPDHVVINHLKDWLHKASKWYTGLKRAFITTYNPFFAFRNFTRDFEDSMFNVRTIAEKYNLPVGKFRAKMLKYIPKAFYTLLSEPWTDNSSMAQVRDSFFANGGNVSWLKFSGHDIDALDAELKIHETFQNKNQFLKKGGQLLELVSHFNDAFENTMRLSVYATMNDMLTEQVASGETSTDRKTIRNQAAHAAKDLMNFERKGLNTGRMNDYWLFLNAGIQGVERSTRGFKNRWKDYAAVSVLGFAVAMMNDFNTDEDDEEVMELMLRESYVGKNNVLIKIGKFYLTVPKPYSVVRSFFNLGEGIYKMGKGGNTPIGTITDFLWDAFDSFNFIGGGGGSASAYLPTLARPFYEISIDENWIGMPITNELYNSHKPKMEQISINPSPVASLLATGLNEGTQWFGGSEGFLATSPSVLQYLIDDTMGGVVAELEKGTTSAIAAVKGEKVPVKEIPLVRSFVNNPKENMGLLVAYLKDMETRKDWRRLSKGELKNMSDAVRFIIKNGNKGQSKYALKIAAKLKKKYQHYEDFKL